jgi:hypothetical protein
MGVGRWVNRADPLAERVSRWLFLSKLKQRPYRQMFVATPEDDASWPHS